MEPTLEAIIQDKGHEYGSTTGRKRKCGWLDLMSLKYAFDVNGVTEFAITKLDVLDGLESVHVCVGYVIDGTTYDLSDPYPTALSDLQNARPIYKTFSGWSGVAGLKKPHDLPIEAIKFLLFLEDTLKAKCTILSTGSDREEAIVYAT